MKRFFWILPALLLLCLPVHAQQKEPLPSPPAQPAAQENSHGPAEWEIFGGYSYLRANTNGTGSTFTLNGGSGSITDNLNDWFGGRFEFNAWGGTSGGVNITAQSYTYGPVFSYRKFGRAVLFGHAQFGAMHVSQGYLGVSQSDTKFAMTAGGGFDFKVNHRAAIRVQADYLLTHFLNTRQNNIQITTGLVIYLGKRKSSPW